MLYIKQKYPTINLKLITLESHIKNDKLCYKHINYFVKGSIFYYSNYIKLLNYKKITSLYTANIDNIILNTNIFSLFPIFEFFKVTHRIKYIIPE